MSEFKCGKCQKYIKPDPALFKVGDKVTFSVRTPVGRSVRIKAIDGEVIASDDETIVVQHRKNRTTVARTGVTMQGAPGPITYQLFGVCKCAT